MEFILLLLLSFFIEAIIIWQYTANLFIPKRSVSSNLLCLSTIYFALFLFALFRQTWLNAALFWGANFLFIFIQFKVRIPAIFFHTSLLTAIMGISEMATMGIVSKFFSHFLSLKGISLIFYTLFSKSLFFTVAYLLSHFLKQKKEGLEVYDRSELFLIPIPVASTFVMLTFFHIGETISVKPPINILLTISAVFLLFINFLVFGIHQYNQKKSLEFTEMQLLLQKESDSVEYYEMLLAQSENQSILIHDIKKHLHSIQLLNEKGEKEKIDAYIHQLLDGSDLKESAKICDNNILNAILNRYQRQCIEKHITLHVDIRRNSLPRLCPNDLTSLFCNLLDNAVEAAENIPYSFIELTVQKKENSPFVVIVLVNSCRNSPRHTEEGLLISHKANKKRHGFGIKSIKKVVNQYQGNLQMYYEPETATFHTIITLKQIE